MLFKFSRVAVKRSLLALSISLGVAQGLYLLHWFDRYNRSNQNAMAFESNRVEIARLDEVLTMSARVYAATGEPIWQDRYLDHVEPLDVVLKETLDIAGSEKARTAISLVSEANDRLIAMEENALALAASGELGEAFNLLTSANYETQKEHYQRGLGEALQISQASISSTVDNHRSALVLGVIAMFLSLLALTELWRRLSVFEQQEVAKKVSRALQHERKHSALQRQFVSMVSHEFRTPLAIIDGNAQRLLRCCDSTSKDRLQKIVKTVRLSVQRLVDLMESVLAAARLENGQIQIEPKPCSLADLVQEVSRNYIDLHPDRQIHLDLDKFPKEIQADEKLIRQVISNIISNAIKYSPDSADVWIESSIDEQGRATIAIRDEGLGIPLTEQNKLFERFFRASTSTGIAGTGIGLNLASHLAQMHGGTIDFISAKGEGTTFFVRLPIDGPKMPEDTPITNKDRGVRLATS